MTNRQIIRRAAVAAVLAAGAAGTGLLAAPLAQADAPGAAPAAVSQSDLAAARAAAQSPSVLARLGSFFAHDPVSPAGSAQHLAGAPDAAAVPQPVGATVPVYTLDPGFVAGAKGAAVARPDFTATEVAAPDGRTASVWTVRQNGGWQVVNIASGSDETQYAALGAAGGGGTVFREPQVNAWYVLRGGRVLPLDPEARGSVGAGGVSLAAYQRLVHQRYGDKLPGSAYDKAGLGAGSRPRGCPPVRSTSRPSPAPRPSG